MSWFKANTGGLAKRVAHLQAGLARVAQSVPYQIADDVAAQAHTFVHIRSGITDRSIAVQRGPAPDSAQVVAGGGARFEEERGGDHAFLSRAVQAAAPQARATAEQAIRAELKDTG